MRVFVLAILVIVFATSSFVDIAHAAVQDHACVHHQLEQDDSLGNEPCHSEQDQSQCDDCCCVHSHSMATSVTPTKSPSATKQQNIIAFADRYYSAHLSGLKRPPRL